MSDGANPAKFLSSATVHCSSTSGDMPVTEPVCEAGTTGGGVVGWVVGSGVGSGVG